MSNDKAIQAAALAVGCCQTCEGDGSLADGMDEAACSIPCPKCYGTGLDLAPAIEAAAPLLRAEVEREVVEWLLELPIGRHIARKAIADAIERGDHRKGS